MKEISENGAAANGTAGRLPADETAGGAGAKPEIGAAGPPKRPALPVRPARVRRPAVRWARGAVPPPPRRGGQRPGPWGRPAFRLALLLLGLLLVAALLLDVRRALRRGAAERARLAALERPEAMMLGIADRRYEDPLGRFALTTPAPWLVSGPAPDGEHAAIFFGPKNLELRVVVNELPHDRFDLLLATIRGQREKLDIEMNIRRIEFQGRPAVERRVRLHRVRLFMIDFLEGRVAHHLQVSAPHEVFETVLPIALEVLETYVAPAAPSSSSASGSTGVAETRRSPSAR